MKLFQIAKIHFFGEKDCKNGDILYLRTVKNQKDDETLFFRNGNVYGRYDSIGFIPEH